MGDEYCPRCGRDRIGEFRFCRKCGFDFGDAVAPVEVAPERAIAAQMAIPAPPGPAPRPRRLGRYVAIGVAGLLGIGALSTLTTPSEPGTPTRPSQPSTTAPGSTTAVPSTATASTVASSPPPTTATPSVAAFAPTGPTQTATVIRVTDGDTIVVEVDGVKARVRYIGMDTLEPDDPDPAARAMADAATAANRALVDGREVILERDVSETDRFDRLLRNVWVQQDDGALVMVGLELVRQGFAQLDTFPPDVKYVDLLIDVQAAARSAEVGLWAPYAAAPIPNPTPITLLDPGQTGRADCDDSYPDVCIPAFPPDLDCGEISERNFTVRGPDPHGFDREGDGLGCEG